MNFYSTWAGMDLTVTTFGGSMLCVEGRTSASGSALGSQSLPVDSLVARSL